MLQVPQYIWNDVAKSGTLKTPLMKRLCAMTDEEIDQYHDKEGDEMEAQGFGLKAILALQMIRPSLSEPEAIRWMAEKYPGIEQAQPIVSNLQEAWQIVKGEYGQGMTEAEQVQVIEEMKKLLKSRKLRQKQTE